jgi:MFS family permease
MSSSELPSPAAAPAPLSLLQYPSFLWLWSTRTATTAAFHMQGVAVGWQLYEMTGSPIDLGIVGFLQFLPLVVFNLVVGQVTDRYDRRAILRNCQVVKVAMVGLLALGTAMGWLTREWMFAFLLVASTARAFEMPSMQALIPSIVPVTILPRAIAAAADYSIGRSRCPSAPWRTRDRP